MITSLHIENYALIDRLDIAWGEGFGVITGETGSGKSIILGALGLLVGEKADASALRDKAKKCIVEGTFEMEDDRLKAFFEAEDLDYDRVCVVRREVTAQGKSRAFVNDTPTTAGVLKEIGKHLVDIHSQHKNLLLQREDFRFEVVDSVGECEKLREAYTAVFRAVRRQEHDLEVLKEKLRKAQKDKEYIEFQYGQLKAAKLRDGEQESLEEELEVLRHGEDIRTAIGRAEAVLSGEGRNLLGGLKEAIRALDKIAGVYRQVEETAERLRSCQIELSDIESDLNRMGDDVDFDPRRQQEVEGRLDEIYGLERKHGVESVAELKALETQWAEELAGLENSDGEVGEREKKIAELRAEAQRQAAILTQKRKAAKKIIEEKMSGMLQDLGIRHARFEVNLEETPLTEYGAERIEFGFAANKNQAVQPLEKIASGGEIARVMLCIKSLLTERGSIGTLILDEIDTGVSGDVAERMGRIMRQMSGRHQVISITHLPQIAAQGDVHYEVKKTDTADATITTIRQLNHAERVRAIASLVGGKMVSAEAEQLAERMLEKR